MTTIIHTFSTDTIDESNIRKAERLYPGMKFSRLLNMIIVEWLEVNGVEPNVRAYQENDI
jgi:hypothetical protein